MKDYSKPIGTPKRLQQQQQTERRKSWTTIPESATGASRVRRGISVIGIILAVVLAGLMIPATFRYHMNKVPPPTKRSGRNYNLVAITQTKAIAKYGQPNAQREYQLTKGSVMGPLLGQKNYVPLDSPDYEKRAAEAKVIWSYPAYSAVRELSWRLPDSYLTIWFQEPRSEVTFSGDRVDMSMPDAAPGEWVALDNFQLGVDLVAKPRADSAPTASPAGSPRPQ